MIGTKEIPFVKSTGDNFTATVSGLTVGHNALKITATDASTNTNKTTKTYTIIYDPTMTDNVGPVFTKISGPASGTIVTDPAVTLVYSITDTNKVDSVYWILNGTRMADLRPETGKAGQYSLVATLTKAGNYTIVISASDKSTNKNSLAQTIDLEYVIPPKIEEESIGTSVCKGENTTVKVSVSGTPPFSYQWRNGSSDITGATNATYTFTPSTTSNLTCVVSNKAAVRATSTPCIITVNPEVTVVVTPNSAQVCSGEIVTYTVTATGGSDFTYQWYKGTPATGSGIGGATENTLEVIATDATVSETYYCVAKNSDGCVSTSNTAAFNKNHNVTLKITAPEDAICPGGNITLTATPTGGSAHTFLWSSGAIEPTCKATAAGTYTCEATSSAGCKATSEFTITKNTLSTKPSIRVKDNGPTTICSGDVPVILEVYGGILGTNA